MPTDALMRSSGTSLVVPATEAWVMVAGTSMSDSTPPRLSARKNSRVAAAMRLAASAPPRGRNDTMPPNFPLICRPASSCWGWDSRPG